MLYTLAVIFTLLGSFFCAVYVFVQIAFTIKFTEKVGNRRLAGYLNRLFSGRKFLLWAFRTFVILSLLSWLSIALPLIDFFTGLRWITTYDSFPSVLHTYYGDFVDKTKDGERLMLFVFLGFPIAKGYWLLLDIAKALTNGYVVTDRSGRMMESRKFSS